MRGARSGNATPPAYLHRTLVEAGHDWRAKELDDAAEATLCPYDLFGELLGLIDQRMSDRLDAVIAEINRLNQRVETLQPRTAGAGLQNGQRPAA